MNKGSFLTTSRDSFIWNKPFKRGSNMLDGGAPFYDTYETKDGKFMAVGAIEPQFYDLLLKGLQIDESDAPQMSDFERTKKLFSDTFKTKTQKEWTEIFENSDACVTPVLETSEAAIHQHNLERKAFMIGESGYDPSPAPKLSRTPAINHVRPRPSMGQHTLEVLTEYGFSTQDIQSLLEKNVIKKYNDSKL